MGDLRDPIPRAVLDKREHYTRRTGKPVSIQSYRMGYVRRTRNSRLRKIRTNGGRKRGGGHPKLPRKTTPSISRIPRKTQAFHAGIRQVRETS